ncbi:Peptidase family M23 [Streptomyces sp. WMMB 714]|uniref:M23 family metallopeptidase n=1 Tax=Streptomyces sp. WMMB 714 TaxID=1286822 RepID=UPI0005F830FF|nr:M23 family metallopeptidase [Streptomyces sp. WMMB 714]SCK48159.1 Peptidase family M23 [Streptomyces sp. WMMB 714]
MAFTHASGRHRRPRRIPRRGAKAVGIAGLTAAGVVGSLATPSMAAGDQKPQAADESTQAPGGSRAVQAAGGSGSETGLTRAVGFGDSIADTVGDQARAQKAAAAEAKAEREAKRRAAAEKAEREREAREKAARAAERAKLNAYKAPVEDPSLSTPYQSSGGLWSSGSHTGVDFQAAEGTKVQSVAAGEVVEAGMDGSFGNNVVIKHRDGTYTQYGHLSSLSVSAGQSVTSGQQVGLAGSTGNTTGPHLHFEARSGPDYGTDMDPVAYLRKHGVDL